MALKKADPKKRNDLHRIDCFRNDSKFPVVVKLECLEFTWNCPAIQQPDYGVIDIVYVPDKRIAETKTLKFYLQTYRDKNAFNEELSSRIASDFIYYVEPLELTLILRQNQRGGIANTSTITWTRAKDGANWKKLNYKPKRTFQGGWGWAPAIK